MKITLRTILTMAALGAASLLMSQCAGLAGMTISFDDAGNTIISPPKAPIVIPAK